MAELTCIICEIEFSGRANKKTCSKTCKNKLHRQDAPANRTHSTSIRQEENRVFEHAVELSNSYYSTPPKDRAEFCEILVRRVLAGENNLRKALTAPALLKPSRRAGEVRTSLFRYRDHMSFRTMAEIVNSYCHESRWATSSSNVFKGGCVDYFAQDGIEMHSVIRDTDRLDLPFAYKEAKTVTRRPSKNPELERPPVPVCLQQYAESNPNPNLKDEAA